MPPSSADRHSEGNDDEDHGQPTPYLRLRPPTAEVPDGQQRFEAHIRWCLCCSNLMAAKILGFVFVFLTLLIIVGNIFGSIMLSSSLPIPLPAPTWLHLIILWLPATLCAVFTALLLSGTFLTHIQTLYTAQRKPPLIRFAFILQILMLLLTIIPGIASIVYYLLTSVGDDGNDDGKVIRKPANAASTADLAAAEADRNNYGLSFEERNRIYGMIAAAPSTGKSDNYYSSQSEIGASDLMILIVGTLVLVLATSIIQLWCILIVDGARRELRRELAEAYTQRAVYFHNDHSMAPPTENAVTRADETPVVVRSDKLGGGWQ